MVFELFGTVFNCQIWLEVCKNNKKKELLNICKAFQQDSVMFKLVYLQKVG